jgi:hypothetical protein
MMPSTSDAIDNNTTDTNTSNSNSSNNAPPRQLLITVPDYY